MEKENKSIWKSYVWFENKCFFVSTIERTFDGYQGSMRGQETLTWDYDWEKAERGKLIHQSGNICDHQAVCRCLIAYGFIPEEEDQRWFNMRK